MNEYEQQAIDFAKQFNVKLTVSYLDYSINEMFGDNKYRHNYKCKLTRNGKSYTFNFTQSIVADDKEPTMYDVLSVITKFDPEDFDNFCSCYGFDNDSMKAFKTYKSVLKEWKSVERLFVDCLEELRNNY